MEVANVGLDAIIKHSSAEILSMNEVGLIIAALFTSVSAVRGLVVTIPARPFKLFLLLAKNDSHRTLKKAKLTR